MRASPGSYVARAFMAVPEDVLNIRNRSLPWADRYIKKKKWGSSVRSTQELPAIDEMFALLLC